MNIAISAIIPAYNEEKYLPETLISVKRALLMLKQKTGLEGEMIVVDNESTDRTAEVALEHGAKVVPYSVHNISAVCNAGVRNSQGEMICRVDADSQIAEDSLVEIVRALKSYNVVGGGVGIKITSNRWWMKVCVWVVVTALCISGVSLGQMFTTREYFEAIGGFSEEHLVREDGEFAFALKKFGKARGLKFANLSRVPIVTVDRKKSTGFLDYLKLYAQIMSSKKTIQDQSKLGFWYNGER